MSSHEKCQKCKYPINYEGKCLRCMKLNVLRDYDKMIQDLVNHLHDLDALYYKYVSRAISLYSTTGERKIELINEIKQEKYKLQQEITNRILEIKQRKKEESIKQYKDMKQNRKYQNIINNLDLENDSSSEEIINRNQSTTNNEDKEQKYLDNIFSFSTSESDERVYNYITKSSNEEDQEEEDQEEEDFIIASHNDITKGVITSIKHQIDSSESEEDLIDKYQNNFDFSSDSIDESIFNDIDEAINTHTNDIKNVENNMKNDIPKIVDSSDEHHFMNDQVKRIATEEIEDEEEEEEIFEIQKDYTNSFVQLSNYKVGIFNAHECGKCKSLIKSGEVCVQFYHRDEHHYIHDSCLTDMMIECEIECPICNEVLYSIT